MSTVGFVADTTGSTHLCSSPLAFVFFCLDRSQQVAHTPNRDVDDQIANQKSQFRAYTDPLNSSSSSNSLNPPSIPPPPPPPPPLNIPPSRARMAFAARLASKRKAEEGGGDVDEGGDAVEEERGLGKGGMSSLLMQGDRSEDLRNPFADDEDEDEDEASDDEDEDGDLGAAGEGAGASGGSSAWNRGGWWRGALGRKKKPTLSSEKFGDGRDSSDSEDEGAAGGGGGNSSDEEFGDFAMPDNSTTAGGSGSGIDADREKVLLKPLPVHPPGGGNNKGLMGLWPFTKKGKEGVDKEGEEGAEGDTEKAAGGIDKESGAGEQKKDKESEEGPVVLSEDGEKVQATVEATRRTSIEEPDEGDEVVV